MKLKFALLVLVLAIVGTAPAGAAPPPGLSLSPSERSALLSAFTKAGRAQPDRAMPDGELWTRVERLASLELGQTLKPGDIDPFWALAAAPRQVDREMSEARAAGRLESWAGSLSPGDEAYAALARTRLHLSGVIGQGGWPRLSEGPVLRQGNIGPGVLALRRRLHAGPTNSPCKWPMCSMVTKITAPTGCKIGPGAKTRSGGRATRCKPCPKPNAGNPLCGAACCKMCNKTCQAWPNRRQQ